MIERNGGTFETFAKRQLVTIDELELDPLVEKLN